MNLIALVVHLNHFSTTAIYTLFNCLKIWFPVVRDVSVFGLHVVSVIKKTCAESACISFQKAMVETFGSVMLSKK